MRMKKLISLSILILFYTGGFFLIALMSYILFAGYSSVKSILDTFAIDNNADFFTRKFFNNIRYIFICSLIIYIGVSLKAKSVYKFILNFVDESGKYFLEFLKALKVILFSKKEFLFFIITLFIGTYLRWHRINEPLSYDEKFTFENYVNVPFIIAITKYYYPNNHIFHTILVKLSIKLFGNNYLGLRFPALLAGMFYLIFIYFFGEVIVEKKAGLITMFLCAISGDLIYYSVHARGYSIICLIGIISSLLAFKIVKSFSNTLVVLFAILSALSFFTIPVFLFQFVGNLIFIMIIGKTTGRFKKSIFVIIKVIFLTALITLIFYSPAIIGSGTRAVFENRYVKGLDFNLFYFKVFPDFLKRILKDLFKNVFSIIVPGFAVAGLYIQYKYKRRYFYFVLSQVISILIICMLKRIIPPARVFLYIIPHYYFLVISAILMWLKISGKKKGEPIKK